jgi:hypothetical protein
MNAHRPKLNYGFLFFGVATGVIGIAISIFAFRTVFLRSAGIALCLVGIFVAKRSVSGRRTSGSRSAAAPDRKMHVAFAIVLSLSILAYALLYIASDDLFGIVILYAFVVFGMLATIIGAFLLGRWTYRMLR